MSQESWGTARPHGKKLAGSVRAARQRVEAGLPLQYPAISRPQLRPQWPLGNNDNDDATQQQGSGFQEAYRNHKGPPPQRPPRPSYVPSMLDASRVQDHAPVQYQQTQEKEKLPLGSGYWESDYAVSQQDPSTPGTGISSSSSRLSTGSSVGSIPDFPVPSVPPSIIVPVQPRRGASIGPPPSARRGASSYYSQSSYVAPIPEETFETPKRNRYDSYASSNAIPQSWTDGPPGYYTNETVRAEDDSILNDDGDRIKEHDESMVLVRKASLGKQYKPSLTTVKSSGSSSEGLNESYKKPQELIEPLAGTKSEKGGTFGLGEEILGPTAFLGPPSEDSTEDLVIMHTHDEPQSEHNSPVSRSLQGSINSMKGFNREQTFSEAKNNTTAPPVSSGSFMVENTPQAGVDGARRAESRASLTSLPDLIRRATRVAANLDKGRTASRLGMLDMFSSSNPNLLDKTVSNQRRHSISDMLTSFPLPAASTPTEFNDRPVSRWPSPFVSSNSNLQLAQSIHRSYKSIDSKRGRRCCGLPVWGFVLILILLILLVAAAIVIPVVLIVLPRQNQSGTSAPTDDLSNCSASHPCENGGTSLVSANSCRCVCVNGFIGTSCGTPDNSVSSCAALDIGSFKRATVGTGIPRLLTTSSSNFSISLDPPSVLSAFSEGGLSCSDENNLVTFSGNVERRSLILSPLQNIDPVPTLAPRLPAAQENGGVMTSNGIIVAAPTTTATTSEPSASATSSSSPSARDFDFARVAVLFILQKTELSIAVDAQQKMQLALTPGQFVAEEIRISPEISVDFLERTIKINGTAVGGQHAHQ